MIYRFKIFENIQQGKSILSSNNISLDDPRWLKLLSIFEKNPGYVGDFTYMVFEKDWKIESVEFIYNTFINNQSNKGIFNQVYPKIRNYTEESFIDELQKLKREKDITGVYNKFPSLQKEIIDKSTQKEKLLYDLSLRKDMNSLIRKISRYHTTRDLVNAIKLFLSSEILDGHNKIMSVIKRVGAKVIIDDESNNLIIVKVNYPQLKVLGSHTSWCILSEGTFDSYNRVCDQYIIYFTDETGNESMIGTTIGKNVRTSHYINDNNVDTDKLRKLLKERGFELSKLFMSEKEFLLKSLDKEDFNTLIRNGFKKEQIFDVRKVFNYREFKTFDIKDIDKYKLKYRDNSNTLSFADICKDFEDGYLTDIDYHLVRMYKKYGDKIIPFISKKYDFSEFYGEIIELVEKVEDHEFTDIDEILKRVKKVDAGLISFLLKRDIKFSDESIAKNITSEKYGNDYYEILSVRPQLFKYVYPKSKYGNDRSLGLGSLSSSELKKIKTITELSENKDLDDLILDQEKSENSKYVSDIVPHYTYQNSGINRTSHRDFLRKEGVTEFGPKEFMSDDIWGRIKKFKITQYNENTYPLFYLFSCVKLGKMDDIKELFPLSYSFIGKVIRTAIYRPGGVLTFSYNGTPYVTKPFFLNDKEEEELFQWMLMNVTESDCGPRVINTIYDRSLMRHKAFSLIYYKYGWGFNKYVEIVSKVKTIQNDIWTKNDKGESIVQQNITRPDLFDHVISYLSSLNMGEELVELFETILNMKLKLYEARSLVYKYSYTRYSILDRKVTDTRVRDLFSKYGFRLNYSMDIVYKA